MKPVIYVDVLIAVNLFVNYFLLLTVAKFLHFSVTRGCTWGNRFVDYLFATAFRGAITRIKAAFVCGDCVCRIWRAVRAFFFTGRR